nr:MAG TPA: hypothetical protein [Caudoviricetes sp.]
MNRGTFFIFRIASLYMAKSTCTFLQIPSESTCRRELYVVYGEELRRCEKKFSKSSE